MLEAQQNTNRLWAQFVSENWQGWCTRADDTFFKIDLSPEEVKESVNKYMEMTYKALPFIMVMFLGLGLFQWQLAAMSVLLFGVYLGLPQVKNKVAPPKKKRKAEYFILKNGQFGAHGGFSKQHLSQVLHDNPHITVERIKELIELAVQAKELVVEQEHDRLLQAQTDIINSNPQSEESRSRAARVQAKKELQKAGIWG